jgi:hypothetical protein
MFSPVGAGCLKKHEKRCAPLGLKPLVIVRFYQHYAPLGRFHSEDMGHDKGKDL